MAPVPRHLSETLSVLVHQAITFTRSPVKRDQTTWDFVAPPIVIRWPPEPPSAMANLLKLSGRSMRRSIGYMVFQTKTARQSRQNRHGQPPQLDDDSEEREPGGFAERGTLWESAWSRRGSCQGLDQLRRGRHNGAFFALASKMALVGSRFDSKTAEQLQVSKTRMACLWWTRLIMTACLSRSSCALDIMFGEDEAAHLVKQALNTNGDPLLSLRDYLTDKFFKALCSKIP